MDFISPSANSMKTLLLILLVGLSACGRQQLPADAKRPVDISYRQ